MRPPIRSRASRMRTERPASTSALAAASPAAPAPMITTSQDDSVMALHRNSHTSRCSDYAAAATIQALYDFLSIGMDGARLPPHGAHWCGVWCCYSPSVCFIWIDDSPLRDTCRFAL